MGIWGIVEGPRAEGSGYRTPVETSIALVPILVVTRHAEIASLTGFQRLTYGPPQNQYH
jgi:hypothetical protein